MRTKAIEAVTILNDFISDAVVGTRCLELFEAISKGKNLSDGTKTGIARMCYFHLILLLAKWLEFYDKYHVVIPSDCLNECRSLTKALRKKKVRVFRNKFVGHVWDKDHKRPLMRDEIRAYMKSITGDDKKAFLKWINSPENNSYPDTFTAIISHLRDRLRSKYNIDEEIFNK